MIEMRTNGEKNIIALCQTVADGASQSYKNMKNILDIDLTTGDDSEATEESQVVKSQDKKPRDPFDYMNVEPFVEF